MRILILLLAVCLSGCTSTLYKGGCGQVTSTKNTVPYTFGTAGGNAEGCYFACIGNCKDENFTPIQQAVSDYIKSTPKENTIQTVDGGVVTYIPPKK
jgi:hypothetical protein